MRFVDRFLAFPRNLLSVKFVRDIATMQVGQIVVFACSFLSSIFFARLLGLEGFGRYAVVLSFAGTVGIFTNLGQQYTTLTFLAEAQGRENRKDTARVLHYYIVLSLATTLLLALFIPFLPLLTQWIYGDAELGKLAQLVFIASMFDPIFNFLIITLQTARKIRTLTILENANTIFQLGVSLLLLFFGWGVAGPLLGSLTASIVSAVVAIVLYPSLSAQNNFPSLREILAIRGWSHLKRFGKQGLWITADKSLGNLYPNLFLFVLSTQVTPAIVGLVRLAMKLANLAPTFALGSISRLAGTVIPQLISQGTEIMQRTIRTLFVHAFAFHLLVSIGAAIAVPLLLPLVYGPSFRVAVFPFFIFLVLNLSLALHAFVTPILRVFSRVRYAAFLSALGTGIAIASFFLSIRLLHPLHSFYLSLILYHCIIALVIFPTLRLLQRNTVARMA